MREDLCRICMQPRTKESASLADWVNACRCNEVESEEELFSSLRICIGCGKRVNAVRQGSFTQWIFRSDLCTCDLPSVDLSDVIEKGAESDTTVAVNYPELENLTVDFPYDRYKPIEEIGKGSRGIVFRSQDRTLNKIVAVKILHNLDPELVIEFQDEARITASLNHRHIIKINDISMTKQETPYMVFEYVAGYSLSRFLLDQGSVDWKTAVELIIQLCSALSFAHEKGIFHRDIQPSNILLSRDADDQLIAKLIDFGLSRIWVSDQVEYQGKTIAGTIGYMSPDQVRGLPYDARSEVYSTGCVLFQLLTGTPPFEGELPVEVLTKQMEGNEEELKDAMTKADISEALQEVVLKCLKVSPDLRFKSIDELIRELKNSADQPFEDVSDTTESSTRNSVAGRFALWIGSGVVAFLILFFVGVNLIPKSESIQEKSASESKYDPAVDNMILAKSVDLGVLREIETPEGCILVGNNMVDDSTLKKVKRKDVVALKVSHTPVSGEGMKVIANWPLKRLSISGVQVNDDDFYPITKITTLEKLFADRTEITGKNFSNFKKLSILVVFGSPIDEQGLKEISQMRSLEVLTIDSKCLTPEGVQHLVDNSPLGVLILNGKGDLSKLYKQIAKIKNLFNLQYHMRHVLKQDIEAARAMSLKSFRLFACTLEEGCVDVICRMRTLTSLVIERTHITKDQFKRIKKSLPDCDVVVVDQKPKKDTVKSLSDFRFSD